MIRVFTLAQIEAAARFWWDQHNVQWTARPPHGRGWAFCQATRLMDLYNRMIESGQGEIDLDELDSRELDALGCLFGVGQAC